MLKVRNLEVGDTVIEKLGTVLTIEHIQALSGGRVQLYFTDGSTGVYSETGEYLLEDCEVRSACRAFDLIGNYFTGKE